jgi:nucleotide-binding universal stress UspA family protein
MKVLIGVDGSPLSLDAVRVVGHIIDPTEDQVAIYFSPTELQQRLPESSSSLVSRSAADLFAEARALLPTEFAKPVEMISSSASAAVGILESANGWHADLVAVGARSHGSIERFLLGSVSRAVLHGAHLPVLIVRSHPPEDGSFRTMACHHPASAAAVSKTLQELHWSKNTDGCVIGVAESMLAGPLPKWLEKRVRDPDTAAIAQAWQQEHDDEVHALTSKLEAFQKDLPPCFHGTSPIIVEGNPGHRILEQAKKDHTDLITIGRTPTDKLSRWLLGSTSEAVLSHAAASVLVVPVEKNKQ